MPLRIGIAAGFLALLIGLPRAQHDWAWRHPLPQGNRLNGLTWTGDQLIAVGDYGTLLTSPDGLTWTLRPTGSTEDLRSVAWSGSRYVAVGSGGVILTSADGLAWQAAYLAKVQWLMGVVWTGKLFVTVGMEGKIFTSPDGSLWTQRASGVTTESWLQSVAWTGSRLVAVGHNGQSYDGTLITSEDGTVWSAPMPVGVRSLYGVVWTGTQVVAVGDSLYTSPDGSEWKAHGLEIFRRLRSVAGNGNRIVALGDNEKAGLVMTSADGATWETRSPEGFGLPTAVVWTGRRYVAVGQHGFIATSETGEAWSTSWKPEAGWYALAHSSTRHVAVGAFAFNQVATAVSVEGGPWEFVRLGVGARLYEVIWHGSHFIAVGDSGRIMTSPDGLAWTPRASGTQRILSTLATSGSLVVAAGQGGTLLTSPDGIAWTPRNPGKIEAYSHVIRAGNRFLAYSDSVYVSDDGLSWSGLGRNAHRFSDIAWSGSRFVGVDSEILLASTDGLTWVERYDHRYAPLNGVAWSGQGFAAVGNFGDLVTSHDGLAWTFQPEAKSPPTLVHLNDILWDGKHFLTAGMSAAILASTLDPSSLPPLPRSPRKGLAAKRGGQEGRTGYSPSGRVLGPTPAARHGAILRDPRKE